MRLLIAFVVLLLCAGAGLVYFSFDWPRETGDRRVVPEPAVAPPPKPRTEPQQPAEPRSPPAPKLDAAIISKLTPAARETHEALFAAALAEDAEAFNVPAAWSEAPPVLSGPDSTSPAGLVATHAKAIAGDRKHAFLDVARVLASPYGVVRAGADIENNEVYVWPRHATRNLSALSSPEHAELTELVGHRAADRMVRSGKYSGWAIAIGADGRWRAMTAPALDSKR
ncbi:MAG: hypothetical protein AAFQ45_13230 [Pseudomonadota bacterium]